MGGLVDSSNPALLTSTGMHPDRWCEPMSSVRVRRSKAVDIATAVVWIRPEPTRPWRARWGAQVDRDEPFVCELHQDRPTCIGFSVRRGAEETFALSLTCDHRVTEAGADKRNLSFVLSSLILSADDSSNPVIEQDDTPRFDSFVWTSDLQFQAVLLNVGKDTAVEAYLDGKWITRVRTEASGNFRLAIAEQVAGHATHTLKLVADKTSIEVDVVLDPLVVGKVRAKLAAPIPSEEKPQEVNPAVSSDAFPHGANGLESILQALSVQTDALQELIRRTSPQIPPAVSMKAATPAERYGSLTDQAIGVAGLGKDIIWLGVIDWDFRIQRPQHIASGLARQGCRVFYISIVFEPVDSRGRFEILKSPEPGVFEVRLKLDCELPPNIYRELSPTIVSEILRSLDEMSTILGVRAPAVVVQYPSWAPVAFGVPGALVVHDCLDLVSGFENTPPEIVALEESLVDNADVVVTTSQPLSDHLSERRPSALIRNAADVEFFAKAATQVRPSPYSGKVIGYFGAIAHWFETEWIVRAAEAHPDWTYVLIGATDGADISDLMRLPNVLLLGERPYSELTVHLADFDVAVIPFKLLDLILCTNPVKLYEYMSAGKPVVASAMPEVVAATELVYIAHNTEEFVSQLERAVEEDNKKLRRARMNWARTHGWDNRAQAFCNLLQDANPKVSIVVLSYQNWPLTQATLTSLSAFSDYENLEIIVVDNGSEEEVVGNLRKFATRDPRIKLVFSKTNLGYAGGNNLGLREATGDYLILLNNDTYVTKGWVRDLIRPLMLDPGVGLVSPLTNNIGNEQKLTIAYSNMEEMASVSRNLIRQYSRKRLTTDCVAFFCVAMRRDVFSKVGYLDEAYGLGFFEDDDYCRRVAAAGFKIQIVDDVFVHHHLSASFDQLGQQKKQELMERNKAIFEDRWGTWKPHRYRDIPGFG